MDLLLLETNSCALLEVESGSVFTVLGSPELMLIVLVLCMKMTQRVSLYAVSIKQQESSQIVRSIFYSCLFFVVSCACVARRWAVEGSRKCMNHEGMCLCWIEPIFTSQRENTHYGPVLSPSLHLQSIFFSKEKPLWIISCSPNDQSSKH